MMYGFFQRVNWWSGPLQSRIPGAPYLGAALLRAAHGFSLARGADPLLLSPPFGKITAKNDALGPIRGIFIHLCRTMKSKSSRDHPGAALWANPLCQPASDAGWG